MAPEKVTVMILDVDLKCCSCYKKVKKVLCKIPEIRDQVFDEDKNKVRITVVCCNPEKIRDKLCCKGGKAIQRIEIVEDKPEKPKPVEKPKDPEKPKPVEKPKDQEKPKPPEKPPMPVEKPKETEKPKPVEKPQEPEKPKEPEKKPSGKGDKPKSDAMPPPVMPLPPPVEKPKSDPPKADPPKPPQPGPMPPVEPQPEPMHGYPPACPVPVCCSECYEGRSGGPCEHWYGRPVPPPVYPPACCSECYEGRSGGPCEYWYGRPVLPPPGPCYDGYGYQYGYGGNRACGYFSEENPRGCSIM